MQNKTFWFTQALLKGPGMRGGPEGGKARTQVRLQESKQLHHLLACCAPLQGVNLLPQNGHCNECNSLLLDLAKGVHL